MGDTGGIQVLNPVFWYTALQQFCKYEAPENVILCISYENFVVYFL